MTLIETQPSTELATQPQPETTAMAVGDAVSLLPVPQMKAVLAEYDTRRHAFREWLLSQLVQGVHYGVVPGTEAKTDGRGNYVDFRGTVIRRDQWRPDKPSLYKAGADFLCDLLMLDPTFSPDLDAWKMLGSKDGTVVICCRLVSRGDSPFFPGRAKGEVIGEGRGAGIAGEKKRDANAALKIAQKSAKVDAVIHALGISDLFTQDKEDDAPPPNPAPAPDPDAPKVQPRAERKQAVGDGKVKRADLITLCEVWRERSQKPSGTAGEFATWAAGVLKKPSVDLTDPANWTAADLNTCGEVML